MTPTEVATKLRQQPEPSEQDESVRKSWARFSHELHRSPDAPYPGMSEAFEQHFSQSFTDREWRAESSTWAAAWKAAKRHSAQPTPSAVAYLDLGVGGYMDIGTDLTYEELDAIPKGRHMLGIVGTYGVEGYVPAQPTPSVSAELLDRANDTIKALRAQVIYWKEQKEPGAAGWRAIAHKLRDNIASMEQQAPAYWGPKHAIEGGSTTVIVSNFPLNPTDAPLYALPGAKGEKDV